MQLNERSLVRAVARRMKRWPGAYWMGRGVYQRVAGWRAPLELPRVPGKVHRNDEMLDGTSTDDAAAYAQSGRRALDLVEEAWAVTGEPLGHVRACLDLGSGYGRVTRWLAQSIPPARITSCDLNREALRFLRSQFGVQVVPFESNWADVELDIYDLVWTGSLVTHLSPASWDGLWRRLDQVLEVGGVVVFSTLGPGCLDRLDEYAPRLSRHRESMQADLEEVGMAYVRYPHYRSDYGIAVHDPRFVRDQVREHLGPAEELFYRPGAWGPDQDAYAFRRGII